MRAQRTSIKWQDEEEMPQAHLATEQSAEHRCSSNMWQQEEMLQASSNAEHDMEQQSSSIKWLEEELIQARLVDAAFKQLRFNPSYMCSSDAERDGPEFFIELDRFAELLDVEVCSRAYRQSFSNNYKALFSDNVSRQYNFDFLMIMVQGCPPMCINWKEYSLSAQVVELARDTISSLQSLCSLVHCLCRSNLDENECEAPPRYEVVTLLKNFDFAWAEFECHYIRDLIHIEVECVKPLIEASRLAEDILAKNQDIGYASWCVGLEECAGQQKILLKCIAELNLMTNIFRKGRGDLNEDALRVASDVLTCRSGYEESSLLVRAFCEDLLESFATMCKYLCSLGKTMESVDPIMPNNVDLVDQLYDLEDAWELFARYVEDAGMRRALDMAFNTLKSTQEIDPVFREMCCDCDAELFLVIPRIVLIAYFMDATKDALVKSFLPHFFEGSRSLTLVSLVQTCKDLLLQDPEYAQVLIHQAVHGLGTKSANKLVSERYLNTLNSFTRELEGLSMELQRNEARDWNAFCALIVQHLTLDNRQDSEVVSNM